MKQFNSWEYQILAIFGIQAFRAMKACSHQCIFLPSFPVYTGSSCQGDGSQGQPHKSRMLKQLSKSPRGCKPNKQHTHLFPLLPPWLAFPTTQLYQHRTDHSITALP